MALEGSITVICIVYIRLNRRVVYWDPESQWNERFGMGNRFGCSKLTAVNSESFMLTQLLCWIYLTFALILEYRSARETDFEFGFLGAGKRAFANGSFILQAAL